MLRFLEVISLDFIVDNQYAMFVRNQHFIVPQGDEFYKTITFVIKDYLPNNAGREFN